MKCFKIEATRVAPRFEITPENFSELTGGRFPFEQQGERQGKFSQYGICPSCLNPIQLIGVMRIIQRAPYGKHTGKDIDGLSPWNYQGYKYCPFAAKNPRLTPNDDERLIQLNDSAVELYDLLLKQIDRIVYVLSKELNIRCSDAFWSKVFTQYVADCFYAYPWLSEANLPYMVAYRGMHHQKVYKQNFLIGSEIHKALVNHSGVEFEKTYDLCYEQLANKKGHYLELFFRFTGHAHKVSEGEFLCETMMFCVDDRKANKTIFQRKIELDETYFMNIVRKGDETKRQQRLLDIADKLPATSELIHKHRM